MKKKTTTALVATCLCLVLLMSACSGAQGSSGLLQPAGQADAEPLSSSLFAMDTYMTLTINDGQKQQAAEAATARINELEALWSVTRETSEIYAVNHSGGERVEVSDETRDILGFALEMARATNGALDPTMYPVLTAWGFTTGENRVPLEEEIAALLDNTGYENVRLEGNDVQLPPGIQVDLGAVGKGYTSDIVVEILREHGVSSAIIDLGGNLHVLGGRQDGANWRVGIRDAYGNGNVGVLEISDAAIVTSGSYERYFTGDDGEMYWHILDPQNGYPARSGVLSVTVVGAEGKLCDALSTALFVMEPEAAISFWQSRDNFEMIMVTTEEELLITDGLADSFTLSNTHAGMARQVVHR